MPPGRRSKIAQGPEPRLGPSQCLFRPQHVHVRAGPAQPLQRALARLLAEARGALANLNQSSHRANVLIAAARGGAAGLDVQALEQEQRQILALEAEIRRWLSETRAMLDRIEGRAAR